MRSIAAALLCAAALTGCTMEASTGPGPDGKADRAGGGDESDATCSAVFIFWQKDAHVDTAGRNRDPYWPPHTTTTLSINCEGGETRVHEQVNHGTSVDDTDESGTTILEPVRVENIIGSPDEMLALEQAFMGCQCETEFLSLDGFREMIDLTVANELGSYLRENLECNSADDLETLISSLNPENIDVAVDLIDSCHFATGSLEEGLNVALTAAVQSGGKAVGDYHVCNNDAQLQARLWDDYVRSGDVFTCDGLSTLCQGPAWFLPCSADDRSCVPDPNE